MHPIICRARLKAHKGNCSNLCMASIRWAFRSVGNKVGDVERRPMILRAQKWHVLSSAILVLLLVDGAMSRATATECRCEIVSASAAASGSCSLAEANGSCEMIFSDVSSNSDLRAFVQNLRLPGDVGSISPQEAFELFFGSEQLRPNLRSSQYYSGQARIFGGIASKVAN
jgi:hypothetical protein